MEIKKQQQRKLLLKDRSWKQEMYRIGNLIVCIILAIVAIIANCFKYKKLEIGNSFQFLFFKKNTWQILNRPRAPMLAGGISNFWQLCHFLTGNFWKMSDYGNSHNLEDVRLWKKCQIMGISIIWKIVKYLSMTRVALLSIFPVFYIISNLCLYIKNV